MGLLIQGGFLSSLLVTVNLIQLDFGIVTRKGSILNNARNFICFDKEVWDDKRTVKLSGEVHLKVYVSLTVVFRNSLIFELTNLDSVNGKNFVSFILYDASNEKTSLRL